MAGIYNGPARGGNRGGKDQFDWEDVKEDKYNQSYLGHSVKAPVGRWQKGKDLTWYTKQSKVDLKAAQEAERREIKLKEQDLMLQMLGEKPMEAVPRADLDRIQKNKLLKKGDAEEGTVAAAISNDEFGERVQGIGYAPIKIDDLREAMETSTSTRLEGTGINALIAAHAAGDGDENSVVQDDHDDHAALLAAIEGGCDIHTNREDADSVGRKRDKKERKRQKKEAKKLRKAEKKARKSAKGGAGERSSSSSPDVCQAAPLQHPHRPPSPSPPRAGNRGLPPSAAGGGGGRRWPADRGGGDDDFRGGRRSRSGDRDRRSRSRDRPGRADDLSRRSRSGGRPAPEQRRRSRSRSPRQAGDGDRRRSRADDDRRR